MTSKVLKRSIAINGRKTSISLEDPFWTALKEIARNSNQTMSILIAKVEARRINANLSSALRVFVLEHYRGR